MVQYVWSSKPHIFYAVVFLQKILECTCQPKAVVIYFPSCASDNIPTLFSMKLFHLHRSCRLPRARREPTTGHRRTEAPPSNPGNRGLLWTDARLRGRTLQNSLTPGRNLSLAVRSCHVPQPLSVIPFLKLKTRPRKRLENETNFDGASRGCLSPACGLPLYAAPDNKRLGSSGKPVFFCVEVDRFDIPPKLYKCTKYSNNRYNLFRLTHSTCIFMMICLSIIECS